MLIIGAMGAALGYVMILVLSWLQRRTPQRLLGRMMAVVTFTGVGLAPVSESFMGYALDRSLEITFTTVGALTVLLLAGAATNRKMWALDEPSPDAPASGPGA